MEAIKGVSSDALPGLVAANAEDYFPMLVVIVEQKYVGHRVVIVRTSDDFPTRLSTKVLETAIKPEEWEEKLPTLERLFDYGRIMEREKIQNRR